MEELHSHSFSLFHIPSSFTHFSSTGNTEITIVLNLHAV